MQILPLIEFGCFIIFLRFSPWYQFWTLINFIANIANFVLVANFWIILTCWEQCFPWSRMFPLESEFHVHMSDWTMWTMLTGLVPDSYWILWSCNFSVVCSLLFTQIQIQSHNFLLMPPADSIFIIKVDAKNTGEYFTKKRNLTKKRTTSAVPIFCQVHFAGNF